MTAKPMPLKSPTLKAQHEEMAPKVLVFAMFAMTLTVLAIVTLATVTDRPVSSTPPVEKVLVSRSVVLSGDLTGAATVTGSDGALIAELTAEDGGFVAGIHRVILRERTKHRVALDGPVILERSVSGRVSITDPSTGWSADLMGFGLDNARTFARLLPSPS